MIFMVSYRVRGLSTGWMNQTASVPAATKEAAIREFDATLARMYRSGTWFVDWAVVSAYQIN